MDVTAPVFGEHATFIAELRKGVLVRTTVELYDHFLNVLPPYVLGRSSFTFREGEDFIVFWKNDSGIFARLARGQVGTPDWTCWADFILQGAMETGEYMMTIGSDQLSALFGKSFPTLDHMVLAMQEQAALSPTL